MTDKNIPSGKRINSSIELGRWIRAARKTQRLTLAEAAGLCGVGVRFLSELERGKRTSELDRALHVARRMGLDLQVHPRWLEGDE